MNTGQTLLTMGALILISLTILNFNRNVADIDTALDDNRFRLEALSVLTSHIEQVSQFFFDEASTDITNSSQLGDFASTMSLGWDSNDNGIIDDIDDLSGTTIPDTGRSGVVYNVHFNVDYVTLTGTQILHSAAPTYHKRIRVEVSDSFDPPLINHVVNGSTVRDTLSMEFVVSYWFYN